MRRLIAKSLLGLMGQDRAVHMLDNPVWHALAGPQKTVAEGGSLALRYDPAVAPFAALPDEPEDASWNELRDLVGPGGLAVLFRDLLAPPDGWDQLFSFPTAQMVGAAIEAEPGPAAQTLTLTPTDVADMLRLVESTEPGPFAEGTIRLGTYVGVRINGRLAAMAGERMHPPGHTEISAVCTAREHRGRGLATALVRDLVGRITARGDTPILHVLEANAAAIRIYTEVGFSRRRSFTVVGLRAPV